MWECMWQHNKMLVSLLLFFLKHPFENLGRDELKKRIADISAFLQEQPTALTKYDKSLVRQLIEKFTVYEDKFTVELKSGVNVEINE